MTDKLKVALVGIPEREQAVFQQVARFTRGRRRVYQVCGQSPEMPADLVVTADEASALGRAQALMQGRSSARLVIVSNRGSSSKSTHLITRPLLISRVLRVLDQASADISESPRMTECSAGTIPSEHRKPNRMSLVMPTEAKGPGIAKRSAPTMVAEAPSLSPETEGDVARTIRERKPQLFRVPPVTQTEIEGSGSPKPEEHAKPTWARVAVQRPCITGGVSSIPEAASEALKTSFKALVVDDSLAIRKQLEIELGEAGIRADFAETGDRALEMATESHFDLVFLDIVMPGIDGYEVCKTLRRNPEHKKTPIIMLSGKTSPLDEVQGVLAGATTYLTKPVSHDGFQTVLGRVVKWLDNYRSSV